MIIRRKLYSSIYDEELGEERIYSQSEFLSEEDYLEEREFGAVKAANKAAKNAWMQAQGTRKGFLGIGKREGVEALQAGRTKLHNSVDKANTIMDSTKMKYDSLNHKINAKGIHEGTNYNRLSEGSNALNSSNQRGRKSWFRKPEEWDHAYNVYSGRTGKLIGARNYGQEMTKINQTGYKR